MKILLSAIPFDNGKSGISVYIREVVKALESAGHKLTLIVEDDAVKEFERFELIRIKKRRALFSMLYSLFILPFRINWKKYDFCIMLAANRRVFCRYPIFTIAVVHDLSQYHVPVKYDRFRMFYIKRVLPHYVRKAQSIVAISKSTRNDLIKYWHIPEEKISVVYNGFTPPAKVETAKLKQILYISRIEHPGKNHLNLLKAFELLPEDLRREYTLVMAENLQLLRAKLGLTQQEVCRLVGVSRQSIVQAERSHKLAWNTYLALVFLFSKNEQTRSLMGFLNIYPQEFDQLFEKTEEVRQ